jgi:hypothetical protein
VESKRIEFRVQDGEYALIEQIAGQMGTSVGRAARQLTISGARATAGFHQSPTDLVRTFHNDLEEFRASLETLNDVASDGLDGLRQDVRAMDQLLVALLRGILQIVTIARLFGDAHDKTLVERALQMAEGTLKQMMHTRKPVPADSASEVSA